MVFADTRLLPLPGTASPAMDRSFTGTNSLFMPFRVRMTDRDGRRRWQSVAVLVGLDNLYGDHNPSGMVIADYTDEYLPLFEPPSPVIKSDLGTPPPGPGTPGPGSSVAGWSREEQAILAAFPELAGAPELARRVQVAYLAARRRYVAAREDRYAGYRAFREELESDPERTVDVPRDGDCFFN